METILRQTGILFPIVLFFLAFFGLLITVAGLPVWRNRKQAPSSPKGKTPDHTWKRDLVAPSLFVLILACSIWLFFAPKDSVRSESPAAQDAPISAAPSTETVAGAVTDGTVPSEAKKTSNWLDELSPMIEKQKNFLFGSWGDGSEFSLDGRTYAHGIGMRICGTQFEGSVPAADAPYKTDRYDCRQVYTEFALRSKYESLTFSIGADNGDKTYYGSEQTNGIAQVLFIDPDREEVLFDTDWVNYSYAQYDVSFSLSGVENLKIVYRTSGIQRSRQPARGAGGASASGAGDLQP